MPLSNSPVSVFHGAQPDSHLRYTGTICPELVEFRRHDLIRRLIPLAVVMLCGCAATGTTTGNVNENTGIDQWESMNRRLFGFHNGYDRFVWQPVARSYKAVLPNPVRKSVYNFTFNLRSPVYIANSLLQGKPKQTLELTARFLINSTLGLAGIWDPAAISAGLPKQSEDFGQTLAVWGINSGPYVVVPFIGPATVRDGAGILVDIATLGPILSIEDSTFRYTTLALFYIDTRARLLGAEKTIDTAADRYVFIREAFLQHRNYVNHDGDPPEEDFEDFEDFEGGDKEDNVAATWFNQSNVLRHSAGLQPHRSARLQ